MRRPTWWWTKPARYHDNPHVFSKPDALFYFHMEHKYHGVSHQRCYETLKYVSEKLALPRQPLHETHTQEGNRHAAAKIRASPAGVVLVAWEHRNIPLLAEALGSVSYTHLTLPTKA